MPSSSTAAPARLAAAALVLGIAGGAFVLSAGASPAHAEDGIGITITVPTASPTPASTAPAPAAGGSASSTGGSKPGSNTTKAATSVAPATAAVVAPAPGVVDLGGKLYISGLSSDYGWSVNPFAGEAVMHFTVRNVSKETISSSVRFWADGPFGNRLDEVEGVEIVDLKPDESRVVEATLTGLGQWTFIQTHATFTPPKTVEGVELASATRDQFLFVPPWLIVGGAGLAFAATSLARLVRSRGDSGASLSGAPA
jgi:hypothetical protein